VRWDENCLKTVHGIEENLFKTNNIRKKEERGFGNMGE